MGWQNWQPDPTRVDQLLRRTELKRNLLRRSIEEDIIELVNLPQERLHELHQQFCTGQKLDDDRALQTWLQERDWDQHDLTLHLARQEALAAFAGQRFGPGLEEMFLQRKHQLDTVVYSLLRVNDHGLARELWIQLSEGEISFAEAASRYSDGPEANTKGVIGPLAMGQLQPELAERLRSLQRGDLREPEPMGHWWVLLRLEQLSPARLDEPMRERLLQEQLAAWLEERCNAVLQGQPLDALHYDPAP